MYTVCFTFLLFMAYSFVGWACETVWCSVGSRRFVNRGFLNGPLCPIYGFGALAVLYLLRPFNENLLTLFLAGMVVTSALEYFTGWLLERLFHLKLWDYTGYFCNINGRVCLRNSVLFGLMGVLLVWLIHPFLSGLLESVPRLVLQLVAWGCFALLAADSFVTIRSALQLSGKLQELHALAEEIREKTEENRLELQQEFESRREQHRAEREERLKAQRQRIEQLNARLSELLHSRFIQRRLLHAFPNMTSQKYQEALERLKRAIAERTRKNEK